jgi:uncharacterized paraquat-inducible protein A
LISVVWCDDCDRDHDPEELSEGGTCPGCGQVLVERPTSIPWHFKLLILATVVYLVYRFVQIAVWVAHHL